MSSPPAGIGPTHGDITADCVAKAFGVPIDSDPRALAILHEWVKTTGAEMNEARLPMTAHPQGRSSHSRGRLASGSAIVKRVSLALSRRKQGFESPRERHQ